MEELFEEVRLVCRPDLPSRMRCHFLSISKEVAEERLINWGWEGKRILTKCRLVLSSGKYYFANIDNYQEATKKIDEKLIKEFAYKYWTEGFLEANYLDKRIELLADSFLYFPEWEEFSKIELTNKVNFEVFTEDCWKQVKPPAVEA